MDPEEERRDGQEQRRRNLQLDFGSERKRPKIDYKDIKMKFSDLKRADEQEASDKKDQ
ncbi:hypothetical protein BEWA_033260 [Theileria equi strain WA]|uniref:Uncharacterized protein n=1 Tax=Theileria equi strain WA TaxID=1537102 RepID=L0AZ11_THEEQ|nr:hypothetical protein BEWA_033260 [Theileria equi strain WA]AFZ80473.1 hypothetical protein BEWA_033260 [Theileria equi strain WA]|eukprot:XP_004830139.1 hypothetical protein BEWA_033260 [Theileria equi strain WA]